MKCQWFPPRASDFICPGDLDIWLSWDVKFGDMEQSDTNISKGIEIGLQFLPSLMRQTSA